MRCLCGADAGQAHAGEEFGAMLDLLTIQNCSDIKLESEYWWGFAYQVITIYWESSLLEIQVLWVFFLLR